MIKQNVHNQVTRCVCGVPLLKQRDSRRFELISHNRGKEFKTLVEHSGDQFKVACSACGKEKTFSNHTIQKSMTYVVVPATG